jgi:hypothetical protein
VGEKRVRSLRRWSPQTVRREQTEDQFLEDISDVDVRILPPFSCEKAWHVFAVPDEGDFLERPPAP